VQERCIRKRMANEEVDFIIKNVKEFGEDFDYIAQEMKFRFQKDWYRPLTCRVCVLYANKRAYMRDFQDSTNGETYAEMSSIRSTTTSRGEQPVFVNTYGTNYPRSSSIDPWSPLRIDSRRE
jgi:hypothetical protein